MAEMSLGSRLKHGWNAFRGRDPTLSRYSVELRNSSSSKPDRIRVRGGNEQSIVVPILNRIAIDVASIRINHVRIDENGAYEETIRSGLNYCLTTEANLDQPSRAFIADVAMSLFDEGCVAVIPVEADLDPNVTGAYDVLKLRTGKILEWFPGHIRVSVYNEQTGLREELIVDKKFTAIIENPLYAVMNERNSTLQRLLRKLNILDAIDEQSGAGKLDVIIQLPYIIKTEARKEQAETRRKNLEEQLAGSKYGIGYTDGTEKITQLNRPAENNLMGQIQYLTSMLYSQLGITESVFNGTANETEMLNYMARTVEPALSAIVDEFNRKFLTKTARTQRQTLMYFKDIFRLVPANELANVADKYTRNEILSSNEFRSVLGYKPSSESKADELRNSNLNASSPQSIKLKDELLEQEVEELRLANELTKKEIAAFGKKNKNLSIPPIAENNDMEGEHQNETKSV